MEENTNPNQSTPTPPTKSPKFNYFLMGQTLLIIAVLGGLAWSIWQNQQTSQQNQQLRNELTELKKTAQTQTKTEVPGSTQQSGQNQPPAQQPNQSSQSQQPQKPQKPTDNHFKPSDSLIDNVTAVFNTMNTQPLQGYMSNSVKVYKDSADNPTIYTDPVQAVLSIDYVPAGQQPWNFRLTDYKLHKTKQHFAKFFEKGCLFGRSSQGLIVSLCFTPEGKIHTMLLCKDFQTFKPSDI